MRMRPDPFVSYKVEPPKTNSDRKTKCVLPNVCMWYIVLVLRSLLVLGGSTLYVRTQVAHIDTTHGTQFMTFAMA